MWGLLEGCLFLDECNEFCGRWVSCRAGIVFAQPLVGTRKIKNLSRQKWLELLGVAVIKSIPERDSSVGRQGLSEAKMELRRKEHAIRQVSKQMSYMESEKNALADRLSDAEKTMTAAARWVNRWRFAARCQLESGMICATLLDFFSVKYILLVNF